MTAALYKPPTKVRNLDIQFKTLVVRADPNFEQQKRREPFYEEGEGRTFYGNNYTSGAYHT